MKTLTLVSISLLFLTGANASEKKEETFHTVKYYVDHSDLRKIRLKECKNLTKMTMASMMDCNNASNAEYESHKNKLMEF